MRAHPLLVAGEGRLDTNLMRAGAGGLVSKGGAEGVQGVGLIGVGAANGAAGGSPPAGVDGGDGAGRAAAIGCVIKVEDGSGRPIPAVTAAFLRAWGASREAATIELHHPAAMLDKTGAEVARIEVLVEQGALRRPPRERPSSNGVGAVAGFAGAGSPGAESGSFAARLFGRRSERLTVSRGDEKDVLRFLREQWPPVDREYFGRAVEWSAEPVRAWCFGVTGRSPACCRGISSAASRRWTS